MADAEPYPDHYVLRIVAEPAGSDLDWVGCYFAGADKRGTYWVAANTAGGAHRFASEVEAWRRSQEPCLTDFALEIEPRYSQRSKGRS